MNEPEPSRSPTSDLRGWTQILAGYREPSSARSILEIVITVLPLMCLWLLMWASLDISYWLCLLLSVPTARLARTPLVIQHDCGHGALFRKRVVNDWVGRVIGVLTLTPYDFWRRTHGSLTRELAIFDLTSWNWRHRHFGQCASIWRCRWRRLLYGYTANPLGRVGVGPAYHFLLRHRLPFGLMRSGWEPWLSTMATNIAIAILFAILIGLFGVGPFLLVHLPVTLLGASIGVWLFYVQHQFEDTLWSHDTDWNFHEAALRGSSHYDLPHVLRWFTANIGVHHIHHLNSQIPYYRLAQVLRDHPQLAEVGRLTLLESLQVCTDGAETTAESVSRNGSRSSGAECLPR